MIKRRSSIGITLVQSQVRPGQVVGGRTVLGESFYCRLRRITEACVVCQCQCGLVKVMAVGLLLQKRSAHCRECAEYPNNVRHGKSYTRLHSIWCGMRWRCNGSRPHPEYGGRGIRVCAEWDSFEAFEEWALASGYAEDLEIDRKNPDGGYSPENCRWATRTQQMRNTRKRRDAKTSTYKGVSLHSQNTTRWVAQIGISRRTTYIGSFPTEIEAAKAYDAAARRHFGDFARTNFTDGGVPR